MGEKRNVLTFFGFFTLNADELGIVLTLGKYSGDVGPGLGFCIPILQKIIKTKASIQTLDLPDQKIVLHGNISVKMSGSVNFKVKSAKRAILDVENYTYSLRQLALTTISDVLGTKTIEDIRSNKKGIAEGIEEIVAEDASKWGLAAVDIRLTDAEMDDKLMRAMMRETEAEKEANAIEIKAKADKEVANIFASAAETLATSPGAMTLRILQTLSDLSNSKSTIVMPIPIDLLSNFGNQSQMDTKHIDQSNTRVQNNSTASMSSPKETKVYMNNNIGKAECPYCDKTYKVDSVIQNKNKFDLDDELPGIQLKCKACSNIFTLLD